MPRFQAASCAIALAIFLSVLPNSAVFGQSSEAPAIRVDAPHLTLISDAGEPAAVRAARQLESFRALIAGLHPELNLELPAPTYLYMFGRADELGGYGLESAFVTHADGNFIAFAAGAGGRLPREIFHHYLHLWLRNTLPDVPAWFDEGFAEYYSTFVTTDRRAVFGQPVMEHVESLARGFKTPLSELTAVTRDSYDEHGLPEGLHAASWALVYYTQSGNRSLSSAPVDLLRRVASGEPAAEAFAAALGRDPEGLQAEIESYLRRAQFRYRQSDVAAPEVTAIPLSSADLEARLGLLMTYNDRADDAEKNFDAALALDPDHPLAHCGRGVLRHRRGDAEGAAESFRRASELNETDSLSRRYLGLHQLQLAKGLSGEPAAAAVVEARGWLEQSVALAPDYAETHALYGRALMMDRDCDVGAATLKRAWQMMPTRMDVAVDLTRLLAACDQLDAARYILDNVLALHGITEVEPL